MDANERVELAKLWERWDELPAVAGAILDLDAATRRAAFLAQDSRCLSWRVAERLAEPASPTTPSSPPVEPTKPSEPGTWSWPSLPGLPSFDLPIPDFQNLARFLPWILVGLAIVVVIGEDRKR